MKHSTILSHIDDLHLPTAVGIVSDMTTNQQIPLRPLRSIARKYAQASRQVGTFGNTEGYEFIRTCFNTVKIRYNCATMGSSFWADVREESVRKGEAFIATITPLLSEAGYEIVSQDQLVVEVRKAS